MKGRSKKVLFPKRLARKVVYESKRIKLYLDKVSFPGGKIVDDFHVLEYPNEAVFVVAYDEKGRILLEQAYRYHTHSIGWEVPAGGIEVGESILDAAARELFEETGHKAIGIKKLFVTNPSNGSSNQVFHVTSCRAEKSVTTYDKNEVKSIKWFTRKQVLRMVKNNQIVAGGTLCALLYFFAFELDSRET